MKQRYLVRITALAASAVLALSLGAAQTASITQPSNWQVLHLDDFEQGTPADWNLDATAGPGTGWSLKKETGNTYLSATGHVTAYLNLGPWTDFSLKGRVRLIGDGAMLNFRTSGCSRYLVPINVENIQIGVTRPDCATGPMLKTVRENYSLNTWYTFQIIGVGSTIDVYVNGALRLEYVDPTPILGGLVSLECLKQADFDDMEIDGPPPVLPAWISTGGPVGGIGYDIKARPGNPDILYVTDANTGLHISTNGGLTWMASNLGIARRAGLSGDIVPVFCVTVDPNNPDIVWVGTQNSNGIFKSVDAGKTFIEKDQGVPEPNGITVRGIAVDPHNSNVVYAAGQIPSFIWHGSQLTGREYDMVEGFVIKSTDGGDHWTEIWKGDNLARYVVIDPRASNVLYVSTGIFDSEAANSDILHGVPGGVGILKSTDGGRTWRTLNHTNGFMDPGLATCTSAA